MAYIISKIGDQCNDQQRAAIIMSATDDATDLPTSVPIGSVAYREDLSARYLFGIGGAWVDITLVPDVLVPETIL